MVTATRPLAVGDFLPFGGLPAAPDGTRAPLRSDGRHATVLVRLHGPACAECRRYLADLADAASDFAAWDGRVTVIVPDSVSAATALRAELAIPFTVVSDLDGPRLLDGAGVLIADRFAHIYEVRDAGAGHALPAPRDVEEWLKFIGTQCPE